VHQVRQARLHGSAAASDMHVSGSATAALAARFVLRGARLRPRASPIPIDCAQA